MSARIHLGSKIRDINNLSISSLPTRPVAIKKAVRVFDTIVMVGEDGALYASGIKDGSYLYRDGQIGTRTAEIMSGLGRLGVLSKEAVAQHCALNEKIKAEERKRWAARYVLDRAADAGLNLTASQRRKLDEAAKEGGAA